jgi:hypothetical protein
MLVRHRSSTVVMTRDTIDVELTPRERWLLLRYGYPFDGI